MEKGNWRPRWMGDVTRDAQIRGAVNQIFWCWGSILGTIQRRNNKEKKFCFSFKFGQEWDSNPRPLGKQFDAYFTALQPPNSKRTNNTAKLETK